MADLNGDGVVTLEELQRYVEQEMAYIEEQKAVYQTFNDFDDSLQPANLVTLAASPSGRILYIVSTESDHRIRIISARDATRHERRLYEEAE